MSYSGFAAVCLSLVIVVSQAHTRITIDTKLGKIVGNVISADKHDSHQQSARVYEFLGIQYGNSPLGDLRFRPSTLNTSWGNSTYDGQDFGPSCIQPPSSAHIREQSENCLYLNIWTPSSAVSAISPVMFWIHGGSFRTGSGSDPSYNGRNFVATAGNVVIVTINYRLGPLGLLASQQLYDEDPLNWPSTGGLNGLYDQMQALSWVHQYIDDFGGDPNDITIFGESAGGFSVCLLLISPILTQLLPSIPIQKAVMESAACSGPWTPVSMADGLRDTQLYLELNNMPTNITELRLLPATEFQFNAWAKSVDGYLITTMPIDIYSDLRNRKYDHLLITSPDLQAVMMGFNSMDGINGYPWNAGKKPNNASEYNAYLNAYIANATQVQLIENVYYPLSEFPPYFNNLTSANIAWSSLNGDCCVACPLMQQMLYTVTQVETLAFHGYVYEFRGSDAPFYAGHGSEIPFVFDHKNAVSFFNLEWNQSLSDSMVSAWSNFGKYGIPNVTNTVDNVDMIWDSCLMPNQAHDGYSNTLVFGGDGIRMEYGYWNHFRHGACHFWYNEVGLDVMFDLCHDLKSVQI